MYLLYQFILNKYQDGYFSGDEFTLLFNQAQNNYYDFLLGHVEQYQYGRPVPRVGINMTEQVSYKLAPFLKYEPSGVPATQQVSKPSDFGRLLAMRTDGEIELQRVEHDRKAYRIGSVVNKTPFYVEYAGYWEVWPATVAGVKYEYYPDSPDAVKWGYTTTSGREVYDEPTSVNPKWKDVDVFSILARMLKMSGVRIDDQQVVQFAESVIQRGE